MNTKDELKAKTKGRAIKTESRKQDFKLASTAEPITPIGGLVSLIAFFERVLERIGLAGQINALMARRHGPPEGNLAQNAY
jgi:hypothetical protein